MAYFTKVVNSRELTADESAEKDAYVAAQVAAGTTDGLRYQWAILDTLSTENNYSRFRMWSSIESANGFKNIYASFNPAIAVAVY